VLYTHFYFFQAVGLILLVAMIGAIVPTCAQAQCTPLNIAIRSPV
jgi:hypothetical protein